MNNVKEKKEVLLSVQHLSQYFKLNHQEFKAVNDVSFNIYKGEVFGLVGESGCGKTTTGRSIIHLYNITSGDIYFKGIRIGAGDRSYKDKIKEIKANLASEAKKVNKEDPRSVEQYSLLKEKADKDIYELNLQIQKAHHDQENCNKDYSNSVVKSVNDEYKPLLNELKNNPTKKELYEEKLKEYKQKIRIAKKTKIVTSIQMIFQDPIGSLNPRMTVQEIISEGLKVKGIKDKKYLEEKVYEVLELVGLVKEHAQRYPHEFSGGQRQRIGVARSVIMEPDMIIADEPVSALDVSIQAQVINLLNELRNKLGLTILFIAHDLSVVKYFSDRIGVMYFGTLVELATSDELFARPLHPYTKSLLSAIPLPDPEYEKERKRVTYNPVVEHDYSVDKPSMREVFPGHFVYCNDKEEALYKSNK